MERCGFVWVSVKLTRYELLTCSVQYITASLNVVVVDPPPDYADPGRLPNAVMNECVVNAENRPDLDC